MSRQGNHPLVELAWMFYPEDTIVRLTASRIVTKGWSWARGKKTDIRKMVRETRPPRGGFIRRTEAVVKEMGRQERIRRMRQANQPINWAKHRPSNRHDRMGAIYTSLAGGKYGWGNPVRDLRHAGKNVVILVRDSSFRARLVIVRPKPHTGPREVIEILLDEASVVVTEGLFRSFGRRQVAHAHAHGRRVVLDFEALETRVEQENGEYLTFPWLRYLSGV